MILLFRAPPLVWSGEHVIPAPAKLESGSAPPGASGFRIMQGVPRSVIVRDREQP